MRDLAHVHEDNTLADARRDPLRKLSCQFPGKSAELLGFSHSLGRATQPFQFRQRLFESFELDGFEKIVDRVHLERIQSESVERCRKNNCRLLWQLLKKLKAGHSGHLNIEKDGIDALVR